MPWQKPEEIKKMNILGIEMKEVPKVPYQIVNGKKEFYCQGCKSWVSGLNFRAWSDICDKCLERVQDGAPSVDLGNEIFNRFHKNKRNEFNRVAGLPLEE